MNYKFDTLPEAWTKQIQQSDVILLQREIPPAINILAAKAAKEANVLVVLDMGGRDAPVKKQLRKLVDIISPNKVRQRIFFNFSNWSAFFHVD